MINNNFEKGNGAPQFDFATFIAKLISGAEVIFQDFVLFVANFFFPAEALLNGKIIIVHENVSPNTAPVFCVRGIRPNRTAVANKSKLFMTGIFPS